MPAAASAVAGDTIWPRVLAARVPATVMVCMPVSGSMLKNRRAAEQPSRMMGHTPTYSSRPMMAYTAQPAGRIRVSTVDTPSRAEPKIRSIKPVLGVKRGRSLMSAGLVSRQNSRRKAGTRKMGRNTPTIMTGKGLMPAVDRAMMPSTMMEKEAGALVSVAMAIFCSSRVQPAFITTGPAILPAALTSPRML